MKLPIQIADAVCGLEQLASPELQERLWLSDGSSGEVCSYDEVICAIFGDSGVRRALDRKQLPPALAILFARLSDLIDKIPQDISPRETMAHPLMKDAKQLSMDLLLQLREYESSHFGDRADR